MDNLRLIKFRFSSHQEPFLSSYSWSQDVENFEFKVSEHKIAAVIPIEVKINQWGKNRYYYALVLLHFQNQMMGSFPISKLQVNDSVDPQLPGVQHCKNKEILPALPLAFFIQMNLDSLISLDVHQALVVDVLSQLHRKS